MFSRSNMVAASAAAAYSSQNNQVLPAVNTVNGGAAASMAGSISGSGEMAGMLRPAGHARIMTTAELEGNNQSRGENPVNQINRALYEAMYTGNQQKFYHWLAHGGNINISDGNGRTMLVYAAQSGHDKVVQMLLQFQKDLKSYVSTGGPSAALSPSLKQQLESVNQRLDAGAHINIEAAQYRGALIAAVEGGHAKIVQLLLKTDALSNKGSSVRVEAFGNAVKKGDINVAHEFVKSGEHINNLLIASIKKGMDVDVRTFLDAGANENACDQDGATALMYAAQLKCPCIAEMLLERGADFDFPANDGVTALMIAASNGSFEVVQALVQAKAEIDAVTNNGISALMFSAQHGQIKVVKELLAANANINIASVHGITALMFAAHEGHKEVVHSLVNHRAEINALGPKGNTALMYAANRGYEDIVKMLVEAGADLLKVSDKGFTAQMLAQENGHLVISEILHEAVERYAAAANDSGGFHSVLSVAQASVAAAHASAGEEHAAAMEDAPPPAVLGGYQEVSQADMPPMPWSIDLLQPLHDPEQEDFFDPEAPLQSPVIPAVESELVGLQLPASPIWQFNEADFVD